MRWNKFFLAAAALALATSAHAENWSQLKGHSSAITGQLETVIQNPEQWKAFWETHTAGNPQPLPAVDFPKEAVVAIFAGQRFRGGYAITADLKGDEKSGDLTVLYQVKEPQKTGLAITMMTQPYLIIKVKNPRGFVKVCRAGKKGTDKKTAKRAVPGKLKLRTGLIKLGESIGDGTGFFDGR